MGVTNSNKELSVSQIECGGSFNVKLSLTAEPDITSNPTDIVLVLDRSGSMSGSPLANLKNGAKKFIDIIDEATDSSQDGKIGSGSRIGIVSFAGTATQDAPLMTSVKDLKDAVDALSAGGQTNHADAFTKALQLFDPASSNAKIIVMFTDGRTTEGGNAAPIAESAKSQGVIIYSIGLSGSGGIDEQALKAWASEPSSAYVAITPDDKELEALFADIAKNITKPGATDIVIDEKLSDCFKITSLSTPTKGTASLVDSRTLQWKIDKLGVSRSEGAVLEFTVQHLGVCSGSVEVNEKITYHDREGNKVTFPSPSIFIDCGTVVMPEPCPTPVEITFNGCQDALEFDAGDVNLESLGRILQINVTLNNVCPHRRVALAVILTEVDIHGIEHKRGFKVITVPAHAGNTCQNVSVRCIKFILPEDLDESGPTDSICNSRRFKARFIAHYIDNDFDCCNELF